MYIYIYVYMSGHQNYLFGPVVFLDWHVPYRSPNLLLHYVSGSGLDCHSPVEQFEHWNGRLRQPAGFSFTVSTA